MIEGVWLHPSPFIRVVSFGMQVFLFFYGVFDLGLISS